MLDKGKNNEDIRYHLLTKMLLRKAKGKVQFIQ